MKNGKKKDIRKRLLAFIAISSLASASLFGSGVYLLARQQSSPTYLGCTLALKQGQTLSVKNGESVSVGGEGCP